MAVRWLDSISDDEERDVGKKAAALATLTEYGVDTPRGFVVTAQTFETFVRENGLENQIESILSSAERSEPSSVQRAANRIHNLIRNTDIDDEVRHEIEEAYEKINMSEEVRNAGGEAVDLVGGQRETEFVAVRSSPTGSRFPGAHETTLNVNGKSSVIQHMKKCWASLYAAEALSMEEKAGTIHSMAVIVQRMVEPDVSGTVFGTNPVTGDSDGYVIESLWGLGTGLYDGSSVPDRFVVDANGDVTEQDVVNKEWRIVRDPTSGKNIKQRVSHEDRESRSLQRSAISDILDMVQKLESRFGNAVRLDFVLSRNRLYALDMERITRTARNETQQRGPEQSYAQSQEDITLRGRPAAAGDATGDIRVLYSDTDIDQIMADDMLVAVNASERLLPVLSSVSGVVTDKGGLSSNLAAAARMLDTPCIVGTMQATDMLTPDTQIAIDGETGSVTDSTSTTDTGDHHEPVAPEPAEQVESDRNENDAVTATQVKVLGDGRNRNIAASKADGAVILDYMDRQQIQNAAATHRPEQIWARTDNQDLARKDNVGLLAQHMHADMDGRGAVLSSYGGVMQSTNLIDRGARFLALDVDALRSDGDRDALLNAVEKIGGETGGHCESALILRSLDPGLIQRAVEHGVDAITVPHEHVDAARREVVKAEKRFMLQKLREL